MGDDKNKLQIEKVENLPGIQEVRAGSSHSLFLDFIGEVWLSGAFYTNLGLSDNRYSSPVKIDNLPRILSISAGHTHSLFLDEQGGVWVLGANSCGQLGFEDKKAREIPEKMPNISSVQVICAGGYHSILLKEGATWVCGSNSFGQLGLGDTTDRCTLNKISGDTVWKEAAAGSQHTILIDSDGFPWTCGRNGMGQLGLDSERRVLSPEKIGTLPLLLDREKDRPLKIKSARV